jgi:phage anti-repressor protein
MNILSLAFQQNSSNKAFQKLINNLMIDTGFTEDIDIVAITRNLIKDDLPNTSKSIAALEKRMQKAIPKVKERVSQYFERGTIAQKVKKLTDL